MASFANPNSPMQQEIDNLVVEFMDLQPQEILDIVIEKAQKHAVSGIIERAIKKGDKAPKFVLRTYSGTVVDSSELLAKGPLIICFYRGGWCPICDISLAHLKEALPNFRAKGAQLVAISPEQPEHAQNTAESKKLTFPVLCDDKCLVAKDFQIAFCLDEQLRPLYHSWGFDVPKHNGDEEWNLPIPATYVIDQAGTVVYSFLNTDHGKRADPESILAALPTPMRPSPSPPPPATKRKSKAGRTKQTGPEAIAAAVKDSAPPAPIRKNENDQVNRTDPQPILAATATAPPANKKQSKRRFCATRFVLDRLQRNGAATRKQTTANRRGSSGDNSRTAPKAAASRATRITVEA